MTENDRPRAGTSQKPRPARMVWVLMAVVLLLVYLSVKPEPAVRSIDTVEGVAER